MFRSSLLRKLVMSQEGVFSWDAGIMMTMPKFFNWGSRCKMYPCNRANYTCFCCGRCVPQRGFRHARFLRRVEVGEVVRAQLFSFSAQLGSICRLARGFFFSSGCRVHPLKSISFLEEHVG